MKADALMALYERVSDAPDAIARLRRFVLDLAVRGQLSSSQNGWRQTTLGEVGEWGSGGTPNKSNPDFYGGNIPWLVIGDLNDATVTRAATHITELGLKNSSAKLVAPGTILVAMYGSIGKLGIAGITCATNQAIAHCSPNSELVSTSYLTLLLRSMREELLASGQGVAQQNISQKILKAWPIQLPPLAEQHRIVAKVDELMALLDRLEAARSAREATRDRLTTATLARLTAPETEAQTLPTHARFALDALPALTTRVDQIKQLRQTIIDLAVLGRLSEQAHSDGTGLELLAATGRQGLPKRLGRDSRPLTSSASGDERALPVPSNWTWASLIELGVTQTGSSPSSSRPELLGEALPFIKPGDMDGATIDYSGPGLSTEGALSARIAPENSVLMVCIGATLGKVGVTTQRISFNQQINSISPHVPEMASYIALALRASSFQRNAWSRAGTGTLPIISKGKWENLQIPVPPLAEQHRIVAKVDELMSLCDRLEAALQAADRTRARLLEALLHEAFASDTTERKAA